MFTRPNNFGETRHPNAVIDCSNDDPIVEQSHKDEVDINNIIKRHGGMDILNKVAQMRSAEFQFDDVTGNDFQEAQFKISRARESFESLPSQIRKEFNNNPAEFLDFVQNPDNASILVDMGLANAPTPPPEPIAVQMVNPITETPPNSDS